MGRATGRAAVLSRGSSSLAAALAAQHSLAEQQNRATATLQYCPRDALTMGKNKLKLASKLAKKRKKLKKAPPPPPPPASSSSSSSSEDSSSDESSSSDASSAGDAAAERVDERTPASSSSDDDDSDDASDAAPNLSGDAELEGVLTLDERIALLEAELARESSDSDSDGSDDDSDDDGGRQGQKKSPGASSPRSSTTASRPCRPIYYLRRRPSSATSTGRRNELNQARRTPPSRASPAQLQQAHRLVDACAASEKVKRELYCRLCAFQGRPRGPRAPPAVGPPHGRDARLARPVLLQAVSGPDDVANELAVHLTCKKHKERLAEVEGEGGAAAGGRGGGRRGVRCALSLLLKVCWISTSGDRASPSENPALFASARSKSSQGRLFLRPRRPARSAVHRQKPARRPRARSVVVVASAISFGITGAHRTALTSALGSVLGSVLKHQLQPHAITGPLLQSGTRLPAH